MTPTLRRKLEALAERREELERLLSDPAVVGDNDRFRTLSREFSQLEPVANALADEARAKADLAAAEAMREDPDLRELADEEITAAQQRLQQLDEELALLLVPRDPRGLPGTGCRRRADRAAPAAAPGHGPAAAGVPARR